MIESAYSDRPVLEFMSTQVKSPYDMIEQLPPDSTLILRALTWDDYEEVLEAVGENRGLRISYDEGTLQIMTLSPEHEKYSLLIHDLVRLVSLKLHIKLLSFGSATMKRKHKEKGTEPDECFYVQTAAVIAGKPDLDFSSDPPPDVAVEIDLHHESLSKFPIYAALGVPEIWRYDEQSLIIYLLQEGKYVEAPSSRALPMLTAAVLSEFVNRCKRDDQYEILLAFEDWLNTGTVASH
jgi:Uma2 family endonuclease